MQLSPEAFDESAAERLALGREAFVRFRPSCFWFWRADLQITEAHLPLIAQGLRENGGHIGFALAARLCL